MSTEEVKSQQATVVACLHNIRKEAELHQALRRAAEEAAEVVRRSARPSASTGAGVGRDAVSNHAAKRRAELRETCKQLDARMQEFQQQLVITQRAPRQLPLALHPPNVPAPTSTTNGGKKSAPTTASMKIYGAQSFYNACNLTVTDKELTPVPPSVEPLTEVKQSILRFKQLKRFPKFLQEQQAALGGGAEKKGAAASGGADTPLVQLMEDGVKAVEKCVTLAEEAGLDTATWSGIPTALLALTAELIQQLPAADVVEEDKEQLKRLAFNAEECEQAQRQAVADGDMQQTEMLYFKRITIQESMVEVFQRIFTTLDDFQKEAHVQPLRKIHTVHTDANKELGFIMKSLEALKKRIVTDLKQLQETTTTVRDGHRDATQRYDHFLQDSGAALATNLTQQEQILTAMEELEKRMVVLGDERVALVKQQLDAIEAEAYRRSDYQQYEMFAQQHTAALQSTLQSTEAAEEVTDAIDEFMCSACNQVERHLTEVERGIERCRSETHDERLKHFRGLYLTLGDLQYKKERNLEELDKKIAQTHIQQELAMETYNPKAKEFSNMKKELLQVREEMEQQLNVISQKAVLHIEAFKPTEVALIASGKQFVHPVEELERMNNSRQQKLLEYHNLMSEDTAGEEKQEAELKAIEQLRQSMLPRKPRSQHGGGGSPTVASGRLGRTGQE